MDLLTRGAGFGYIGSHHHLAHLRQLHLHLLRARSGHHGLRAGAGLRHPARLGLPAVRAGGHPAGHARRHRDQPLQVWTQPLWLAAGVPYVYVFIAHPTLLAELRPTPATSARAASFNPLLFGAALTVGIALITQMGEQVDYLRFMPEKNRRQPQALVGRRAGGRARLGAARACSRCWAARCWPTWR
jgi:hypothetical protein